jgi:hypothetical protein
MLVILSGPSLIKVSKSDDEWLVSFGFGDPASLFGVMGEWFGVDALGGEDGQ